MALDITKPNWGSTALTVVFNVSALLSLALVVINLVGLYRNRA